MGLIRRRGCPRRLRDFIARKQKGVRSESSCIRGGEHNTVKDCWLVISGFSFLFHRKDNKSFFAAKFTLLLFITMPTTSKRFIQEAQVPYEVHSNMLLIDDQVHSKNFNVSDEYKMAADTLYLNVNLIDRFLSNNYIEKLKMQLLGITCMLMSTLGSMLEG